MRERQTETDRDREKRDKDRERQRKETETERRDRERQRETWRDMERQRKREKREPLSPHVQVRRGAVHIKREKSCTNLRGSGDHRGFPEPDALPLLALVLLCDYCGHFVAVVAGMV